MNEDEATRILDALAAELRRESYDTLVARYLSEPHERTVVAESGVQFQVEVQAFWDTPRQPENLRVIIAIDDGGWRSFRPLSTDFIILRRLIRGRMTCGVLWAVVFARAV